MNELPEEKIDVIADTFVSGYFRGFEAVSYTHLEITVPSIKQFYLEVNEGDKVDVLARLIDVNDFKLSMVFWSWSVCGRWDVPFPA